MTPRERVMAVVNGEQVDRKPVIAWPGSGESDVHVGIPEPNDERLCLIEVPNPCGQAYLAQSDLSGMIRESLLDGSAALEDATRKVHHGIEKSRDLGADGIIYELFGADPSFSSPMEYGGHFLEVDREILSAYEKRFRVIFLVGGQEAFLDFVSDLPGEIFAWDVKGTGVSVAEMRKLRKGVLAAADPEADILLTYPGDISVQLLHSSSLDLHPSEGANV
jgi:hypothetical protein